MLFATAQLVNLPACSSHCPFNADRQAGKLNANFKVIGLTRLGIKLESKAKGKVDLPALRHHFS